MEIFAFTQNSVGYEDPGAEPQLRSFDEINLEIPKSAIAGAVGTVAAVGIIGTAPDAHALVRPGAQCPAVATIQQAVGVSADTVYGPITTGAVRAFQSRTPGLIQDGIVGPNTARALGLPAGISCGVPDPESNLGGTVSVGAANIRSGPGLSYSVISVVYGGQTVTYGINTVSANGYTWAPLLGRPGWIATSLLGGTPGSGGSDATGVIDTSTNVGVNVRATPGGVITGSLGEGARVTYSLSSRTNGWVQLSGGGWVAERLIR